MNRGGERAVAMPCAPAMRVVGQAGVSVESWAGRVDVICVRSALRAAAWISEKLGNGWIVSRRTGDHEVPPRERGPHVDLGGRAHL